MKDKGSYILFFAVCLLLQILLLNRISLTTLLAPTVYVACIIIMPLDSSQFRMLITGLLVGMLMDVTMGTSGLNVLATLPIAFFRRPILHFMAGFSDIAKEEGAPTAGRLGRYRFHRYVISMVALHSLLFFGFESLTFDNFVFLLLRLLCSAAATLLLVYLLILLFTPKLSRNEGSR